MSEPGDLSRRVVVKVGSQVLSAPDSGLAREPLERLANNIADARTNGRDIVLVSSGAIACGWPRLGFAARPRTLPLLQAAAAAGQTLLMRAWEEALAERGLSAAQILLTHIDVTDRRRYLNARETIDVLLAQNVIPVVNENDTVAVDEIRFGDNDSLSADVTVLTGADLLVILTEVEGLMSADPRRYPEADLIPEVTDIETQALPAAGAGSGPLGRGGMVTKVDAARRAVARGAKVVIASGLEPDVLPKVLAGEPVGTRFTPTTDRLSARKTWIAYTLKRGGTVVVDAGARRAVVSGGKSLLPSGVVAAEGSFQRGEAIGVVDEAGAEVARGISVYAADELRRIAGRQSSEIEAILGYTFGEEVIHRNDLVVL